MKKRIVLFTLVLFLSGSVLAEIVSVETAQKVASNLCFEKLTLHPMVPGNQAVTITSVHTETLDGVPVYFVFFLDPAGFVIISAEDRIFPVIGYSFEHSFGMGNRPPNVQYWLDKYAKQITYVGHAA